MSENFAVEAQQARDRWLNQDHSVNLQQHYQRLDAEQANGLNGIEIRERAQSLGKDEFLKILIAQLSHQDPTQPMQDQEFIAQMAQFSSLEQMKNMSDSMERMSEIQGLQSINIVGRYIVGKDSITGEQVMGRAEALFYGDDGETYFKVNDSAVVLSDVRLIGDPQEFRAANVPGVRGSAGPAASDQGPAATEAPSSLPRANPGEAGAIHEQIQGQAASQAAAANSEEATAARQRIGAAAARAYESNLSAPETRSAQTEMETSSGTETNEEP
ncbi:MAG: endoflagellar hook capping protein [Spirochaetales bacterium]|nr:endoflagellar hook capping protein [Leptospiraceae bacterium]MCP5480801.1 endoflagellar hook capping protein [Spirochaetales bacterium]